MRLFKCDCGHPVFFENTICLSCGAATGFDPAARTMLSLDSSAEGILTPKPGAAAASPATASGPVPTVAPAGNVDASGGVPAAPAGTAPAWKFCGNLHACGCNWLLPADSANTLCDACATTRTIPPLAAPQSQLRWQRVEIAKRRLLFTLLDLSLWGPNAAIRPTLPLTFDLLEPIAGQAIMTGHQSGVVTINITEADDDARERTRISLHEPYRTLSGHFRHEVGHFYWEVLIRGTPYHEPFRKLFGDESADYNQALQRHYAQGPPPDWVVNHVSAYATVHPWEDWAETWAHLLHMRDTLETADNAALSSRTTGAKFDAAEFVGIEGATQANAVDFVYRIERWTSIGILCNELSRSMGQADVYPFALTVPVLKKLFFIERVISKARSGA